MSTIWHNGAFKPDSPVFTSSDRIRLGDGVFDTMLAVDGKPVDGDLHLARLLRHAAALSIDTKTAIAAYKINNLHEIKTALLAQNNLQNGRAVLNTIISRGSGERGLRPPTTPEIQIVIRAAKAPNAAQALNLIIAESTRRNEGSPLSRIKSFNYGDNVIAVMEAQQKNADDAILLNNAGDIACTTIGNIFACIDDALITPPQSDGVVDGIFRTKTMQHYDVKERSMSAEDLLNSDGVYVTNSVRGAVRVTSINGASLPTPSITIPKDFHL